MNPLNLLAVDDATNKDKGDKGPDEWRPPLKSYWNEYARRWRAVKSKYGLYISPAEESTLSDGAITKREIAYVRTFRVSCIT